MTQPTTPTDKWGKLTRQDIRHCDDLATEIVLVAMALGGLGRVGKRGHPIIKAPTGRTFTLAPKLPVQNRSAQNSKAEFRRAFGISLETAQEKVEEMARRERADKVAESRGKVEQPAQQATKPELFWCPIKGCPTPKFTSLDSLLGHVEHAHYICKEVHENDLKKFPARLPNGWLAIPSPQGLAGHKRIVHEGHRPRPKGLTKEEIARRRAAEKQVVEVVEEPEEIIESVPAAKKAEPTPRVLARHEEAADRAAARVEEDEDRPWFSTTTHVVINRAANADEILQAFAAAVGGGEEVAQLRAEIEELKAEVQRLRDIETRWNMLREQFGMVEKA